MRYFSHPTIPGGQLFNVPGYNEWASRLLPAQYFPANPGYLQKIKTMSKKCLADIFDTLREFAIAFGVVELCRYLVTRKFDHLAVDAAVLAGLQFGTPISRAELCRLIIPISAGILSLLPELGLLFRSGDGATFLRGLLLKMVYIAIGTGISFFYHKFKRTVRTYL